MKTLLAKIRSMLNPEVVTTPVTKVSTIKPRVCSTCVCTSDGFAMKARKNRLKRVLKRNRKAL